ncbi:winged helix-turn-helix transcriptional regulator [Paramicrobacterium agarici]|uniref:winged helix-turn-helix transcriptional regulator n=1 Tax=Paramicrobacterium agarici TaxID=630514 RepID=UPI001151FCBE|nr:helix-turn-helix domain-containing protein [Microbacterium agarici]TQO22831.1 HxlR family transcriptional regulator [Microbacterium agarici]
MTDRTSSRSDLPIEEAVGGACPSFVTAMDIIGRRWTGIIIEAIGRDCTGFAEISRFVGHIGDTMLAKRLRELETDGLVERTVVDTRPLRVRYTLTIAGLALLPILEDITSWGHAYGATENPTGTSDTHERDTRTTGEN